MDATQPFPFHAATFTHVFSEHMIEHVSLKGGLNMLRECCRVLVPGGKIRISCPDREFVKKLAGDDELSQIEAAYVDWACREFGLKDRAEVGMNLATGFGHQFIYSVDDLRNAMIATGFENPTCWPISDSSDTEFRGLENAERMPLGFLQIETMTFEARAPA
jgi:SAM-dependent methyltransferase